MAFGKNPRAERKSSSPYGSTVVLVVFVALCLIGVWMMTSSSITPIQTINVPSETKIDMKDQISDSSTTFEDASGGLSSEATQTNNETPSQVEEAPDNVERQEESPNQEVHEENNLINKGDATEDTKNESTETDSGGQIDAQGKNPQQEFATSEQQPSQTEEQPGGNPDEPASEGVNSGHIRNEVNQKDQGRKQDQNDEYDSSKYLPGTESGGEAMKSNPDRTEKNEKRASQSEENREQDPSESYPDPAQSEILNETNIQTGTWKTQATESEKEKDVQELSRDQAVDKGDNVKGETPMYTWKLCNVTTGADYIPCLDNEEAIKHLRTTKHYEHRERHCPDPAPTCVVPLPKGYKRSIEWPKSRDKIWYHNVPHTLLAEVKGHQNWVKVSGEHLIFPGGGTQFKNGAQHYIDFIQEMVPNIAWGKSTRVILDVGCGVASFGGYLFDNNVITMSFAPKDEHEAQVQFALERGIPAISAVMGTQRLPFPSKVFDIVHCARCRVPWHIEGGKLLLELNRVLRPGGYFVWSATPVYQHDKDQEDAEIWREMKILTKAMCWDVKSIKNDRLNEVGAAIYQKPTSNDCYESRKESKPPMYVPLQACMHKVPVDSTERGSQWPEQWPLRLEKPPYWLSTSQTGVYGRPAPEDFKADYEHWKHVVNKSYLKGLGINWSTVRNIMDMRAVYGGFAAALKDLNVWVLNVVPIDSADTLPIIYERGLFGIYHDWCESFSTYPRSYDLLHADHLFSNLKKRCNIIAVVAETDRILRPEGKIIVRDDMETINEIQNLVKSLHWEVRLTYSKDKEGLLCAQKMMWRPGGSSSM
ncbi:putative methyltransferase [Nymphaea thermarum]|nr:putative methyltransferase [Nymphaea thermarum]